MTYTDIQGRVVAMALSKFSRTSFNNKPVTCIGLNDRITILIDGLEKKVAIRKTISFIIKPTEKIIDMPNGWFFPVTKYGPIEIKLSK